MVLLRVVTYNEMDPLYIPKISSIEFSNLVTGKKFRVTIEEYLKEEVDIYDYCHYWLGVPLPPGNYYINRIKGYASMGFPLGSAPYVAGTATQITVPPNAVVYGGIVQITNKDSHNVDYQNAAISGLRYGWETTLSSALAGFINGVFVVSVIDNQKEDIDGFKLRYPALRNHNIAVHPAKR